MAVKSPTQKKIEVLEVKERNLRIAKLEAELELISEEIESKKLGRWIMRVTSTITGLTLLTTIFNYLGLFKSS